MKLIAKALLAAYGSDLQSRHDGKRQHQNSKADGHEQPQDILQCNQGKDCEEHEAEPSRDRPQQYNAKEKASKNEQALQAVVRDLPENAFVSVAFHKNVRRSWDSPMPQPVAGRLCPVDGVG